MQQNALQSAMHLGPLGTMMPGILSGGFIGGGGGGGDNASINRGFVHIGSDPLTSDPTDAGLFFILYLIIFLVLLTSLLRPAYLSLAVVFKTMSTSRRSADYAVFVFVLFFIFRRSSCWGRARRREGGHERCSEGSWSGRRSTVCLCVCARAV